MKHKEYTCHGCFGPATKQFTDAGGVTLYLCDYCIENL